MQTNIVVKVKDPNENASTGGDTGDNTGDDSGVIDEETNVEVPNTGHFSIGSASSLNIDSNYHNVNTTPLVGLLSLILICFIVLTSLVIKKQKHSKPNYKGIFSFTLLTIVFITSSILSFNIMQGNGKGKAIDEDDDSSKETNALTITAVNDDILVELEDEPVFATGKSTVKVTTATEAGYTLIAYASGTTADLINETNPSSKSKISSLSTEENQTLTNNTWGVSLTLPNSKDQAIYTGISTDSTNPLIMKETEEETEENDETILYLATYVTPELDYGTYTGATINYVAIANPVLPYMQDVAEWKDTLEAGDEITVKDKRDEKTYTVARLADGNIWMTQNLDLDLDSTITLTPEDTDIKSNWTPERSTYETGTKRWSGGIYDEEIGDWVEDPDGVDGFTHPESYDPGELYMGWDLILVEEYYNSCDDNGCDTSILDELSPEYQAYFASCDTGTTNNCDDSLWTNEMNDSVSTTGDSHYSLGNYYNWTAAIAMNDSSSLPDEVIQTNETIEIFDEADQSICPAGWTLPKGGDLVDDPENGSFQNLVDHYGWDSNTRMLANNYKIWNEPIYLALSGVWHGELESVGDEGYFWSSRVYSSSYSYLLIANAYGVVFPYYYDFRFIGQSVRCIAR